MPPDGRDPAYLWDMLEAARGIQEVTCGLSLEQYLESKVVRLAVERELEILGEAAKRVSGDFKDAHPEIPWRPIIAQRNVLAHEYGEIEHFRIWKVVITHIPTLNRTPRASDPTLASCTRLTERRASPCAIRRAP